jgi:hypothetical protein
MEYSSMTNVFTSSGVRARITPAGIGIDWRIILFDLFGRKVRGRLARRFWYRRVYLKSNSWLKFRAMILYERSHTCQKCGKKRLPFQLNVHHLTYARVGHERREDVQLLCIWCHAKEHGGK